MKASLFLLSTMFISSASLAVPFKGIHCFSEVTSGSSEGGDPGITVAYWDLDLKPSAGNASNWGLWYSYRGADGSYAGKLAKELTCNIDKEKLSFTCTSPKLANTNCIEFEKMNMIEWSLDFESSCTANFPVPNRIFMNCRAIRF